MNVRIYQINMKRDTNNVAFMNYESLPKFQGSSEIDSSLYDKVFEGEVNCFTLEKLYEIFNLEHPAGYKGRSMSVSDVVEIIDGNTGKSYFHFCDSFGFQQISFKPEKTQVSDRFLSLADQEKISVLLVPVGKSPVVKEIPNTYEAMKELVGGGGCWTCWDWCCRSRSWDSVWCCLHAAWGSRWARLARGWRFCSRE